MEAHTKLIASQKIPCPDMVATQALKALLYCNFGASICVVTVLGSLANPSELLSSSSLYVTPQWLVPSVSKGPKIHVLGSCCSTINASVLGYAMCPRAGDV